MRVALFLATVAVSLTLLANPTQAEPHTGNLHNCEDFTSQQAAQAHLGENPSDPDNLDADDDGIACENFFDGGSSQGGGSGGTGSGASPQSIFVTGAAFGPSIFSGSSVHDDAKAPDPYAATASEAIYHDCADFGSQKAAQSYLDDLPSDPVGLDKDNDGVACEHYFKPYSPPKPYVPAPSDYEDHDHEVGFGYGIAPNPPTSANGWITPPSTGDAGLLKSSR